MAEIVVYGNPLSTYTRTARMALEEKGVAYELEPVDHRAPEFRKIHPFGRIPALRHGDFVLYETMAICRYVDEAFAGPSLQPAELRTRALMVQWVSATLDYFYPAMVRKLVFERLVAPAQGRAPNETLVAESVPEIEHQAGVLARALDGRAYLAGEAASIADLFVYPVLFYVSFAPEGQAILARAPALAAWLARMSERASAEATMPPIDKISKR